MDILKNAIKTRDDYSLFVVRVVLGLVMLPHALQKLFGWFGGGGIDGTLGFFGSIGIPAALGVLAIAAESFGAIGLITGFLGRFAALGVASVMLGAMAKVHLPNGFFMNWFGNQAGEGFEYHLLVLAMTAAIVIGGSGAFSVDGKIAGANES